jgi:hypothetical protein
VEPKVSVRLNIYMAGRYERQKELRDFRDFYEKKHNFNVVSTCLDEDATYESSSESYLADRAQAAMDDMDRADVIVVFGDGPGSFTRGGRHVELGYMLRRIREGAYQYPAACLIGPCRENIFHFLTGIIPRFDSPSQSVRWLQMHQEAKNRRANNPFIPHDYIQNLSDLLDGRSINIGESIEAGEWVTRESPLDRELAIMELIGLVRGMSLGFGKSMPNALIERIDPNNPYMKKE